ncbi:CBS domain-containing protein [Myxococcota bacterium]|nr:CBS domain-containing protein [Myxococcota bacterium]
MVSLDDCSACGHCEGLVFDGNPGASYIVCKEVPTPHELRERRRAAPPGDEPSSVGEVMTRDVVCVRSDLGIDSVRELLLARGFGGAPVVDDDGHPIGIISKTDLLRAEVDSLGGREVAVPAPASSDDIDTLDLPPQGRTVGDVMRPSVMAVGESAPICEAAAVMAGEHVHRVPVVASDGKVVGILSSLDVLRWIAWENGYLIPERAQGRAQEW